MDVILAGSNRCYDRLKWDLDERYMYICAASYGLRLGSDASSFGTSPQQFRATRQSLPETSPIDTGPGFTWMVVLSHVHLWLDRRLRNFANSWSDC